MYHIITSLLLIHQTFATTSCLDRNECTGETIDTTATVSCLGFDACSHTTITTTSDLMCFGYEGCSQASYLNGNPVRCYGFQGCFQAEEIVSVDEILCDGTNGCMYAGSLEANAISCNGKASCFGVDSITVLDSVQSEGALGMWNVSSISTPTLQCMGILSCLDIDHISATSIISAGLGSLHRSHIDSYGLIAFDLLSVGYYSAYQASIYCRSGTECSIVCQGSGCFELYVYYETSASQLSIDPSQCKSPKNRGEQIADKTWATWCPYIVSSDEMTRAEFEDMKEERMSSMIEKDPVHKEVFDMLQKTMRKEQNLIEKSLREMESREFMAELTLINGERLSYVKWSPDNVWIIAGVLGMFMIFACYYAYRKNKEYEVVI